MDSSQILGRPPEQLSLQERSCLSGKWIALEIYTKATLPLRRIEAVAATASGCAAELSRRQLDPAAFEFVLFQARR